MPPSGGISKTMSYGRRCLLIPTGGWFLKSEAAVFSVKVRFKSDRDSEVVGSVAYIKSGQNRDARVAKGFFYNRIHILKGFTVLKGPENNPGDPFQVTSKTQLSKHTIDAVGGLSPVLYEENMAIKVRLIGCADQVAQAGQIATY